MTSVHLSPSREAGRAIEQSCSASSAARIGASIATLRSESEPCILRPTSEPKGRHPWPAAEEAPMPKLELTIPAESLSNEAQQELARDLGAALLRWEGAPDTEFFRSITWAHVHALPAGSMQTPDGVA